MAGAQSSDSLFLGTMRYRILLPDSAEQAYYAAEYPTEIELAVGPEHLRITFWGGIAEGMYLLLDSAGGGFLVQPRLGIYTDAPRDSAPVAPIADTLAPPDTLGHPAQLLWAAQPGVGQWRLWVLAQHHFPPQWRTHPCLPFWARGGSIPLDVFFAADSLAPAQGPRSQRLQLIERTQDSTRFPAPLPPGFRYVRPSRFYVTDPY